MGIPAQVVELQPAGPHTAVVDVDGAQREVNTVMVDDEPLSVGDWVLLHVGFAMARVDASEAAETLEFIRQLGSVYDEEMEAFTSSPDA
ncbi:MAG: HypC/HybG/HupF family hydrogenase formation chaperone [Acidimicrobiaceae bacterium]|nr:HypC/HybG/HupF family hydrogenase formation chaperone [Acidimicrobiaceae bacterium]